MCNEYLVGNGLCIQINRSFHVCACFDGWMCRKYEVKRSDFEVKHTQMNSKLCHHMGQNASQVLTVETGMGIMGKCRCHANRICSNCQVSVWNVDKLECPNKTLMGEACKSYRDCSSPRGNCMKAACVCSEATCVRDVSTALQITLNQMVPAQIPRMMRAMRVIPTNEPPTLKEGKKWSKDFVQFLSECLKKAPEQRLTCKDIA